MIHDNHLIKFRLHTNKFPFDFIFSSRIFHSPFLMFEI